MSAQEDLERTKEELKTAVTPLATPLATLPAGGGGCGPDEGEHSEQDDEQAEASAELSNEGVSQLELRSEEQRVTEAQKNERVKQQLQVGRGAHVHTHACTHARMCIDSLIFSLTHIFTQSCTHLLTSSCTHSFTRVHTHSHFHSLMYSLM